jgi:DNA-binding transcriptional ArsR family regulator
MAWCNVVKTYCHPPMREVALPALMQALSDPCRLAIVRELLDAKGRALACNEVRLNISKATRSHHFEVLRAAGMIRTKMEGTKCMTSLRRKELNQRFPGLLKLIAAGIETRRD